MQRYKTASERTSPVGPSTSLRDEYAVLEEMYDAAPDHVPEPQGLGTAPDSEQRYAMEEIDGTTVQDLDYDDLTEQEAEELADDIEATIGSFHDAGVLHGDVCTSNVLVDDQMTPYFIDPAGIRPEHPGADPDRIREQDTASARYIGDRIRR